jgi:hypothetical protein
MFRRCICPIIFLGPFLCSVSLAQSPLESNLHLPAGVLRETAPSPLPHVKPAFEDFRFWTGRQPEPDKIILNGDEIERINREALKSDPEAVDIFSLADGIDSAFLKTILSADRQRYGKGTFFDLTNRTLLPDYFAQLFSRMNLKGIPAVLKPLYGLITREANLRVLPSDDLVMDRPFDYAFDRFQSDKLDCGTAVAVLHYTADHSWCFVETGYARGWVRPNDVAIGTREEVMRFAAAKPLVVAGDAVPFYRDRELTQFVFDLPMGARLPFAGRDGDTSKVYLPWRNSRGGLVVVDGYVRSGAGVHEGYLPYTTAAVMRQAFKLKENRYSWGGLHEGRDCSRFIMDVFRCFGFQMPRDSYRQAAFAGNRRLDVSKRTDSEKVNLLQRCQNAPTLLYMKGHVMLLLGVVDGRAYAIHSYWDYGTHDRPDVVYHVGRVAVTDLSVGKNGEGDLLRWISALIPLR